MVRRLRTQFLQGSSSEHVIDLSAKQQEGQPVFVLDRVQFSPPHNIVHMVASSSILVMALAGASTQYCGILRVKITERSDPIRKITALLDR